MSSGIYYQTVTDFELKKLLTCPSRASEWLNNDQDENYITGDTFGVEAYWHVLHFILNGEALGGRLPLWNAVLGGHEIYPENMISQDKPGHFTTDLNVLWEGVRYLSAREVSDVAEALRKLDKRVLREHCNVDLMRAEDIYRLDGYTHENEAQLFELMYVDYQDLLGFFDRASLASNPVVMWLG